MILFLSFTILLILYNQNNGKGNYQKPSNGNFNPKDRPDEIVKKQFDTIYEKKLWSATGEGDGSGPGSKIEETRAAHKIIIDVINEYKIKSMIDAPCGSFLWMSGVMRDVKAQFEKRGERFRYHGVDVVESVIEMVKKKYGKESEDWSFSVCDFSAQALPQDYELVFSRDALMHLPYEKVCLFY